MEWKPAEELFLLQIVSNAIIYYNNDVVLRFLLAEAQKMIILCFEALILHVLGL